MDLLMCHQAGFTNALATSGTSLTRQHLEKIKRYSEKLMIVYDADSAGVRASIRAWALSLSLGLDVKIAILPNGEDPASLILKSADEFKACLKNAKHVVEFALEQIINRFPKGEMKMHGREIGKAVNAELLPLVARIDSSIDRAHFASLISDKTFIPLESVQEDLAKTKPIDIQTFGAEEPVTQAEIGNKTEADASMNAGGGLTELSQDDKVVLETVKRLVGITLLESLQLNKNTEVGAEDTFSSDPELKKQRAERVKTEVYRIIKDSHTQIANEFERLLADAPQKLIFETELLYKGSQTIDKEITHLLLTLEESILKKAFGDNMREMQIAEKAGDKPRALKLLVDCQELSHKMSALQHTRMNLT
jgi:DNA primase